MNVPTRRSGQASRLTSALIDGFFFGAANFSFCWEPVVELRAGFVPVLDVEFVGAALDSFFEGEPFLKAFFCRCRCCHWDHLWLEGIIGVRQSEAFHAESRPTPWRARTEPLMRMSRIT